LGSGRSAAKDRLWAVYAALACGVVVLDTAGRVVEANAAAEDLLGVPLERMRGQVRADYIWRPRRPDGSVIPLQERPAIVALRTCKASEFLRQIDAWGGTKRHSRCARNVTVRAPSFKGVTVAAPIRAVCISGERRYCIARDAKSRSNRGG